MDIDDPGTTDLRNEIIQSKPILKTIYEEWYSLICDHLPEVEGPVLELGSGAGFLRKRIPGLITSEVFPCRSAQLVLDGQSLPFASQSLRAVMTNVLHHVPKPPVFLSEASRCLLPGGSIVMIEPWVSNWSRMIYTRLHHEPFDTGQPDWSHSFGGPLSGANGALPWITFERDRRRFEREFSSLRIDRIQPIMPFRYLLSGGVSMRQLLPAFLDPGCAAIERGLQPWMKHWAMFGLVAVSRRTGNDAGANAAATV